MQNLHVTRKHHAILSGVLAVMSYAFAFVPLLLLLLSLLLFP